MANYLARVELHKATSEDYETLHEAMRKRGFTRFIVSSEKKKYRLPTGTGLGWCQHRRCVSASVAHRTFQPRA